MHRAHDPGTTNPTEGAHAASKLFVPEPTTKYNAGIQYNRLIHRRCASLDLEITILPILVTNRFPTWRQTNRRKNCTLTYIHLLMKKWIEKLQQFAEHLNTTR